MEAKSIADECNKKKDTSCLAERYSLSQEKFIICLNCL